MRNRMDGRERTRRPYWVLNAFLVGVGVVTGVVIGALTGDALHTLALGAVGGALGFLFVVARYVVTHGEL